MKTIDFKGSNIVMGEGQEQYIPLHAHRTKDGAVTSCWEFSFKERIKLLLTGRLFIRVLTFNKNHLQPIKLLLDKPPFNFYTEWDDPENGIVKGTLCEGVNEEE